MKKIIVICAIFFFVCLFINSNYSDEVSFEKRGIFVSYIELNKYIKDKDINTSKNNINKIISNIKNLNFNLVILQVRSFSDAIYPSNIYPFGSVSEEGVSPGYDILKYFIDLCHKNNILLYAWINPYRIRNTNDVGSISSFNPAYKWINSRNVIIDNGIYYNPSSDEVIELISSGVLEIVKNYDVDGILFDDYFYPSTDCDYNEYLSSDMRVSYDEYKLDRVNKMIRSVYSICKEYDVLFGISPDANIDNNYNKLSADIYTWLSDNKYIDFIMPQVYYGFFNESKAFKNVIDEWEGLIKNPDIELMVALAFYKVGNEDKWAKSGYNEWVNNSNIIMREIILSRNLKYYGGFSLFRYDYIFNDSMYTKNTLLEVENMKKVLK